MNARQTHGDRRKARLSATAAVAAVLSVLSVLSALPVAAGAADRVALVIGNSDYKDDAWLRNPVNDAVGMAEALEGLGFVVVLGKDLKRGEFYDKLYEFKVASRDADVTLFFYAGHGLQVEGENWLMPINAKLEKKLDLRQWAVELHEVMKEMRGTKKLVFLDACRNNPLATRGLARDMGLSRSEASKRGLARVEGDVPGTLVVYATQADDVASDGDGDNSPFTKALLAHIVRPELNVFAMIDEVAQSVYKATKEKQKPSIQSTPMGLGNFYLASAAVPPPDDEDTGTAGGGTATTLPPPPSGDAARAALDTAKEVGTVAAYQSVVKHFPGTFEADMAQAQIAKLEGDTPEEVEQGLGLSTETKRLVQMGLAAAGHDPDGVDGMLEGKTRRALRAWQESKEVEATGYLTKEQGEVLVALGREESERRRVQAERKAREAEEAERRAQAERDRKAREAEEAERRAQAERERKAREAEERRRRAQAPGTMFRDCPGCPELVVVPEGTYRMGSPESESGRRDREGPVRRVTIGYRLAVGVKEVTRGEFARFVSETGRSMGGSCWEWDGEWKERSGRNWKSPGYSQTDEHPVVCVSWDDAKAYVDWLSGKTGKEYRLLSEAEWEYVARAGTRTARYWGESESGQCRYANGADEALKRRDSDWKWTTASCDDGFARTAPVGAYEANGFGLHDVLGNVSEWTEDCYNESYRGAPSDGSAWESGNCSRRVLRGGSWDYGPGYLRSANRSGDTTGVRLNTLGFRVARTLTP